MSGAALVLVDVQKGLDDPGHGERSCPEAEANIASLLAQWRARDLPVIHVRHCSVEPDSLLRPGLPGNEFKDEAMPVPGEPVFEKSTNSAFVGTGLKAHLRERGIDTLVVAGLTADHCVSATTRSAADLGFDVTLVGDATAAFGREGFDGRWYPGESIHRVNLVSLQHEFCEIRSTRQVLDGLR